MTTVRASTTSTQTRDDWDSIATWRGGAAGEYRTEAFAVPFRFTTTSAWTGSESIDSVSIRKTGESGIWLLDMGFGSLEEAVGHFQELENAEFAEPSPTSIGDATAVSMEGTSTGNQSIANLADGLSLFWSAGTETTLYLVDVEGDIVVIVVDRSQPIPLDFVEEAQSILDSIVWRALDG